MNVFCWKRAILTKPINRGGFKLTPSVDPTHPVEILVRWDEFKDKEGKNQTRYCVPQKIVKEATFPALQPSEMNGDLVTLVNKLAKSHKKPFDIARGTITLNSIAFDGKNRYLPVKDLKLSGKLVLRNEYLVFPTVYADEFELVDEE